MAITWTEAVPTQQPELRRRLVAFARRLVGDDDAEDLAQEALVRASTCRTALRRAGRAEAWLFRICRHAAIDHLRSRRVRRGVWQSMPVDGPEPEAPSWPTHSESLATKHVAMQYAATEHLAPEHLADELWSALGADRLAPHQGLLIALHYRLGLGQARLCALTGLSPAALRVRLFRARRELRDDAAVWHALRDVG